MTTEQKIKELEKQLEELKQEIAKQDKKEHKSLSDYRCCRELEDGKPYKYISYANYINDYYWHNDETDKELLSYGNIYTIDTPNELLEREIKKRQLWFALEKHLKEKGCLATNEDWKDENISKYCVYYDFMLEVIEIHEWTIQKTNTIYSINKEVLENYMDTLSEEDIKIIFDVE